MNQIDNEKSFMFGSSAKIRCHVEGMEQGGQRRWLLVAKRLGSTNKYANRWSSEAHRKLVPGVLFRRTVVDYGSLKRPGEFILSGMHDLVRLV